MNISYLFSVALPTIDPKRVTNIKAVIATLKIIPAINWLLPTVKCSAARSTGANAPAIELINVFIEITSGNSDLSAKLESWNGIVALIKTIPIPENILPIMCITILLKKRTQINDNAKAMNPYAIV
jgi:hypothetical protein